MSSCSYNFKTFNVHYSRIDGSILSGKILDFIGDWTKLTILNLQGTSVTGPIPSGISLLRSLDNLRGYLISFSSFPNLRDMKYLILRNCLIKDSIPAYIAEMTSLNTLSSELKDLSFNRLFGQIPYSIQPLESTLNFLYLK
ncbi:putative leucine-rich repeat receptor-like serine/threonine-protein kinase [Heracleum sosnowskyi]|uniref:Leucine-rich repeat receptor-like serine/threonine-protein kinase n=1 Tax=Heracleum sosnowskyi TaxID=360622 RepID=A0AAD8J3V1_9APIA|nr:putative leucine-rich repeat receptor-like serine/threonine-protein kinase [Heracleum sosnowskyi]